MPNASDRANAGGEAGIAQALEICRNALIRLTGGLEPEHGRILVAVSGGPDSLALLWLLHHIAPGRVCAATIDHQLRPESAAEAEYVATLARKMGVEHAILRPEIPISGNLQSQARKVRYALLHQHLDASDCQWIATGHHGDDQLETMLMRLNRGSGVDGLAGIRARNGRIIRPLLELRRLELLGICRHARLDFVRDPSNEDVQFDRVRMRQALAGLEILDASAATRSAAALSEASKALDWAVQCAASQYVQQQDDTLSLQRQGDWPAEILRRLVLHCLLKLGASPPRGEALAQMIEALQRGEKAMLSDILVTPGPNGCWRFAPAPQRRTGRV